MVKKCHAHAMHVAHISYVICMHMHGTSMLLPQQVIFLRKAHAWHIHPSIECRTCLTSKVKVTVLVPAGTLKINALRVNWKAGASVNGSSTMGAKLPSSAPIMALKEFGMLGSPFNPGWLLR